MNRQRGLSSLALVLLILILGSLLLAGYNQQLSTLLLITNAESRAIRQQAAAHSAMEWARTLAWQPPEARQCQQHTQERWWACLRRTDKDDLLLSAGSEEIVLWRLGKVVAGRVLFSPHGWSDFCPFREAERCQ